MTGSIVSCATFGQALMIGDTEYDMQMAANAGSVAIGVSFGVVRACGWITMALCFLQVLREPVVQYLAGSEQRIAPFWNIITWYPAVT